VQDTSELKGLALQIAAQLPNDRKTALAVLAFTKELVEWQADEGRQSAAITVLPPRMA
jgi:hypothetical protein